MALAPSSICTSGIAPKPCTCLVGRSFPQAPTLHHPACKGGQVPVTRFPLALLGGSGTSHRWAHCPKPVRVSTRQCGQTVVHGGRVSLGEVWTTIEPVRAVHTLVVWSGWLSMPGAALGLSRFPCLPGGGLGEGATLGEAEPRTGSSPGLVPYKTSRAACTMNA